MLHAIGSAILGAGLFLASLFGVTPEPTLGLALPSGTAVFETSLASRINSTDTSLTLASNSVRGGSSLSGYNCFVVDEGRTDAEFICGTVSGTSVTSLERGIDPSTGTSTNATLKFAHRVGANVKITDFPLIQRLRHVLTGNDTLPTALEYASALSISSTSNQIPHALWVSGVGNTASTSAVNFLLNSANTFLSTNAFPAITSSATSTFSQGIEVGYTCTTGSDSTELCPKAYIDSVAIAGASDASQTVKGITEEATEAEILAGTAAGATGARLFINPSTFRSAGIKQLIAQQATTTNSTGARLSTSTALTAGQVVMVWAKYNTSGSFDCNGGNSASLYAKSNTNATTTLDTSSCHGGGSNGAHSSLTFMGQYIATTTETVEFYIGGPNYMSGGSSHKILIQKFLN